MRIVDSGIMDCIKAYNTNIAKIKKNKYYYFEMQEKINKDNKYFGV